MPDTRQKMQKSRKRQYKKSGWKTKSNIKDQNKAYEQTTGDKKFPQISKTREPCYFIREREKIYWDALVYLTQDLPGTKVCKKARTKGSTKRSGSVGIRYRRFLFEPQSRAAGTIYLNLLQKKRVGETWHLVSDHCTTGSVRVPRPYVSSLSCSDFDFAVRKRDCCLEGLEAGLREPCVAKDDGSPHRDFRPYMIVS